MQLNICPNSATETPQAHHLVSQLKYFCTDLLGIYKRYMKTASRLIISYSTLLNLVMLRGRTLKGFDFQLVSHGMASIIFLWNEKQ